MSGIISKVNDLADWISESFGWVKEIDADKVDKALVDVEKWARIARRIGGVIKEEVESEEPVAEKG